RDQVRHAGMDRPGAVTAACHDGQSRFGNTPSRYWTASVISTQCRVLGSSFLRNTLWLLSRHRAKGSRTMNRTMRRSVAVTTGAVAPAGAVAACGTGGEGGGGSADSLSVWIMQGTNPDADAFFDEVATAFEEETGATLDVQFVEWGDAHDRFVTSIAGGTTPD